MSNDMAFAFNCTVPPRGVHFVHSPPVRGTLDIVWSCFGVLLLSTWDILSINWIDTTGKPPARGKWPKFKKYIVDISLKVLTTIVVILFPEIMTADTAYDWSRARKIQRKGAMYAIQDGVDWNLAKAYYANMKGFRVEFANAKSTNNRSFAPTKTGSVEDVQGLLYDPTAVESGTTLYVSGEKLIYLRSIGVLESLPDITEEELDDKNKSNGLLQMLALLQTLWLVIQVTVRHVAKLFVTQLEIVTLAFAALSIVKRAIDWKMPKDIRTSTPVKAARHLTAKEKEAMDTVKQNPDFNESHKDTGWAVGIVIGLLFGGLHCLAWNEEFPTPIEKTLWRVATLGTTLLPLSMVGQLVAGSGSWRFNSNWIWYPLVIVYSLMRLFIMAETGRSLFFQPPDTYISTWTANFPHLG